MAVTDDELEACIFSDQAKATGGQWAPSYHGQNQLTIRPAKIIRNCFHAS